MKRIMLLTMLIISILINLALSYGIGVSFMNESKLEGKVSALQKYQSCLNDIRVYESTVGEKTEFVLFSDIENCQK